MRNTNEKPTIPALAAIYGTNERQIARWKAAMAPLHDVEQMVHFWLSRKSYPDHLHTLTDGDKAELQQRLDALYGVAPATDGAWTYLDDLRAIDSRVELIHASLRSLTGPEGIPPKVRAVAERFAPMFNKLDGEFFAALEGAGVAVDNEVHGQEPNWQTNPNEDSV